MHPDYFSAAPSHATGVSRRALVRLVGATAWAVPALPASWLLAGCASGSPAPQAWATGGTARIDAAVRNTNPFLDAAATTCRLACEATIGPCHTLSPERADISDGWDGLPMHVQLRIVDEQCRPVQGAIVEIWHTNHTGGYSGHIVQMCNNDQADVKRQFFRGWQRTDAQGVVRFDSCFPGWYRGRANHVHLRVLKGDYDPSDAAASWLTSQLMFPDALNTEIFGSAPLYRDHGQPDTTLATDNVLGAEPDPSPYLFDVRNAGGVMLASKTLAIRSSLEASVCQARGTPPPGGPGGPGGRAGPAPGGFGRPPRMPRPASQD